MTMDDLEQIFWNDVREQPVQVRLKRVVRALRDDMQNLHDTGMYFEEILATPAREADH